MNKLEANVSLFIITFFAAIQYVFLKNIPDSVSHFAYLTITNVLGFTIIFIVFFKELFRLDKSQLLQSFILSLELFVYNIFMLLGTADTDATVSACVLSSYFMFIPLFCLLLFREKPKKNVLAAMPVVLFGIFLFMGFNAAALKNISTLYLLIADVFFSLYIITTEKLAAKSNPAILAMGQLFFNLAFSSVAWLIECVLGKATFAIPGLPSFWGSVIFISFFIRGLYSVVQIYAQRYVSAFNTSLIFSSEILMTMLMSPILARVFGTVKEEITPLKLLGGLLLVLGILIADPSFIGFISKKNKGKA